MFYAICQPIFDFTEACFLPLATTLGSRSAQLLGQRGLMVACPLMSLARVGLARAYALEGDTAKACTAYQDFFALWKDADPDIPILNQAKAECAKLQ